MGYSNDDKFRDLNAEVERISQTLQRLQSRFGAQEAGRAASGTAAPPLVAAPLIPEHLVRWAAAWQRANVKRNARFEHRLFLDPAWSILLDLYIQQGRHRRVGVSAVAGLDDIPQTTLLRWLTLLAEKGLIERSKDQRDGRRSFIKLSPDGIKLVSLALQDAIDQFEVVTSANLLGRPR